jgi:hypothetical protein
MAVKRLFDLILGLGNGLGGVVTLLMRKLGLRNSEDMDFQVIMIGQEVDFQERWVVQVG